VFKEHRFTVWGGVAGIAYWLLESMLHAWFWGDGQLAVTLVAEYDPNELFMRLVIVVLLLVLGRAADLQHLRLHDLLQQQQRTNELLQFLTHLNQHVQRQTDPRMLYNSACHAAIEYGRFDAAAIVLDVDGVLTLSAMSSQPLGMEQDAAGFARSLSHCGVHRSLFDTAESRMIRMDDGARCGIPWYHYYPHGLVIMLPLFCRGQVVGVLDVLSMRSHGFSSTEISLLEEAADDISVLLSQFELERLRQHSLAKIEDHRHEFQLLLNSTSEGILGVDGEGRCYFVNQSALKLLGYTDDDDVLGHMACDLLLRQNQQQGVDSPLSQALQSLQAWHAEDLVFYRGDESTFPVECWVHPTGSDDKSHRAVLTFVDVSKRKYDESERANYTQTLERFQRAAVQREFRMKELRMQVQQLKQRRDKPDGAS